MSPSLELSLSLKSLSLLASDAGPDITPAGASCVFVGIVDSTVVGAVLEVTTAISSPESESELESIIVFSLLLIDNGPV